MTLEIENPRNFNLESFIKTFLIPKIQESFIKEIDNKRLLKIEEFINKLGINIYHQYISVRSILIAAIDNLEYLKLSNNNYILRIDSNQMLPNISAKLIDLAYMINYGTLSTPAYPIFTKVFSFFADRLQLLYAEYLRGVN